MKNEGALKGVEVKNFEKRDRAGDLEMPFMDDPLYTKKSVVKRSSFRKVAIKTCC